MAETMKLWIRDNCQGNWLGLCDRPCDKAADLEIRDVKLQPFAAESGEWQSRECHESVTRHGERVEKVEKPGKTMGIAAKSGKIRENWGKLGENAFVLRRGIANCLALPANSISRHCHKLSIHKAQLLFVNCLSNTSYLFMHGITHC